MLIKFLKQFVFYFTGILIVSFALTSPAFAQVDSDNLFSVENRLEFGNYLFCEKDYLRALSEYRYYLQQANDDTVRFKIAMALAEMGSYNESIDNFKGLFYNSDLSMIARLEYYKTSFLKNSSSSFRKLVESKKYFGDDIADPVAKLYHISLMKDGIIEDSVQFISAFKQDEKENIAPFYSRKKNPGYKDEDLAGILSALLPGLGKVYADETGDGITSFLFTGVLTFLAINNFNNDHPARGWIFSGLAAYFYAGNIYGSIAAAQNYNVGVNFRFDSELNLYLSDKNWFIPKHGFLCK